MIERFEGAAHRPALLQALAEQRLIQNNSELAEQLLAAGQLVEFAEGDHFITEGDTDTDIYFIVAGRARVLVHGKVVAERGAGEAVGEMSVIERTQPRTATLVASKKTVLLKVPADAITALGEQYPSLWRAMAAVLARRLSQRNAFIAQQRQRVTVFIVSSREAIPITNLIVRHFAHDPWLTVRWQHGVFKASSYPLDDLEQQLEISDFAIAIASADDRVEVRGQEWPSVRDNVIFELGLFMGRLGRRRAFLLEPRTHSVKLPSDTAGLTSIGFKYEADASDAENMAMLDPACAELRARIMDLGARE